MKTRNAVYTQFVVSKTRVAPLQTVTIPRLELLSALLLSRLVTNVFAVLESTLTDIGIEYYTDSTVALYWITGINREWRPFVQN